MNTLSYIAVGALLLGALSCREDTESPTEPAATAKPIPVPEAAVSSNTWIKRADMPNDRHNVAVAVVKNAAGQSILYAMGGAANGVVTRLVQAYNASTNTWSTKAPMPKPLVGTNGAGVISGKIYVSGGAGSDGTYSPALYVYDPAKNSWLRRHDMPLAGAGGITGVINGKLYVLTTTSEGQPVFGRYNPATDRWSILRDPTVYHEDGIGGVLGGKFYVTGGSLEFNTESDRRKLEVYDPLTNLWTTRAPMPRARSNAAVTVRGGKLYAIGGFQLNSDYTITAVRTNSVYDPVTNTWTTKAPLPSVRYWTTGATVSVNGRTRIEVVGWTRPGNNLQYVP